MATEYWYSEEVKEMAEGIIAKRAPELVDAKIVYVMKEKCSKKAGKLVLGKTKKASPMQNFFLDGCHYIIELGADGWQELNPRQREAALYHYLCYCFVDVDEETNEYIYKMRDPDIQEFSEVISTYGFWHEDLKKFGRNVKVLDLDEVDGDQSVDIKKEKGNNTSPQLVEASA